MKTGIVPIKICWSKRDGYGFITANAERTLWFVIRKETEPDRKIWKLHLAAWYFYRHINLKTILDDFYIRCELCGGNINKNSGYCSCCGEYPDKDEQTWVFRNSKNKGDLIIELSQEGYNIEYEK